MNDAREHWPLNSVAEARMDPTTPTGETHRIFNGALAWLRRQDLYLYWVLSKLYLEDPEKGHGEVDFWRSRARWRGGQWAEMIEAHDRAVEMLAHHLIDEDLFVRLPADRSEWGYTSVEERNSELERIYVSYVREGWEPDESIMRAANVCDYSPQHAWRIVRARLGDKEGRDGKSQLR
jgi:hypothetical protein